MTRPIGIAYFFFQLIIPCFLFGQGLEKHKVKANDESLTYYLLQSKVEVNGILVLLPGSGENPKSIFDKTDLPQIMSEKGFLIVVPELNDLLFADPKTIEKLDTVREIIRNEYGVSNLIVGGFSSGGAVAIGYAKYLLSVNSDSTLKGVFAIDPPLDLERVHASSLRKINYDCQGLIQKEGYAIKQRLEQSLGGSPESKPDQYLAYSSYSSSASDGGNAKYLTSIPIRLYTEPDLDYVQETYCPDLQYADINAVDTQGLYKFLWRKGNKNAEYIATKGKGFHSWNILEASDCAEWIIKITK